MDGKAFARLFPVSKIALHPGAPEQFGISFVENGTEGMAATGTPSMESSDEKRN
jgi:hypothetical protein